MKKKNAQTGKAELSANTLRKYTEIKNTRGLRMLHALMVRLRERKEMERIVDCTNPPSQVSSLCGKGFDAVCKQGS
jgi:hypothetical protein